MVDSTSSSAGDAETALRTNSDALERHLHESEVWLAAQKEAFQAAIDGAPLRTSLDVLVRTAVGQWGSNTRCAFYIADAERAELHHVTGMAESYAECVDGFRIGADSLACGLAVYTGQPVITPDVRREPVWQDWLWLADQYCFRGCWSFPIETLTGQVVGTFALYFEAPRDVTPRDQSLAAVLTRTAAIIISRNQEIEQRERAVESLRASEAALRRALAERESLLKELHHRVKNNLQVIMSLLEMQAAVADPRTLSLLTEARNRVGAIASMHELLYRSDSVSEIDLSRYAGRLAEHLVSFYEKDARVSISVIGDDIRVELARAVPLGLLLNELISNACKHAFADDRDGRLEIRLRHADGQTQIRVKDTGPGLPSGLDRQSPATLGLQLVHMLAEQLGGRVTFECDGGTIADVQVPQITDPATSIVRP